MLTRTIWWLTCATSLSAAAAIHAESAEAGWSPKSAAAYLDERANWWATWPEAARDQNTFCISCHTALPYALSRAALGSKLGQAVPAKAEVTLISNVTKRVRLWNRIAPYYEGNSHGSDNSTRSRGTEAVLNALILANHDAENVEPGDDTRTAFDNMWRLQRTSGDVSGSWSWLQFDNEPWEAHDSEYYGAALAAVAVGTVPSNYRFNPNIQANLQLLRGYLSRQYANQSIINHVVLLWASERWPGLLNPEQQAIIVSEVVKKQRQDGGWNLGSLIWSWRDWSLTSLAKMWRSDDTPLDSKADAYATGLVTFVLEQAGLPPGDAHVKQGRGWLARNQDKATGAWPSYSVNGRRDPSSGMGRFMSDAGTAYAVLALTVAR